jgi:hypothetical protein
MAKTNAENVRAYYERNKKLVLFRKVMKRCREHGSVPNLQSMRDYDIPLTAILVAFADWAGSSHMHHKIKKQHQKLTQLRVALGPVRKTEFEDPTPAERKALTYLRRFSHPHSPALSVNSDDTDGCFRLS